MASSGLFWVRVVALEFAGKWLIVGNSLVPLQKPILTSGDQSRLSPGPKGHILFRHEPRTCDLHPVVSPAEHDLQAGNSQSGARGGALSGARRRLRDGSRGSGRPASDRRSGRACRPARSCREEPMAEPMPQCLAVVAGAKQIRIFGEGPAGEAAAFTVQREGIVKVVRAGWRDGRPTAGSGDRS